ncbi:MAG: DNA-processing protein DprA, partial [Flavobacteriaceae bacterium]
MSGATGSRPPLSPDQKRDWLRLYRSENVGPATFRTLINRFGSAAAALDALPALSRRGGLSRAIRVHSQAEADAELDLAAKLSLRLVTPGEAGYPPLLAHTDAAPPILFLRGSPEIMARPAVANVGARNATAVGRRMAHDIASQLGRTGIVIASG